jgi:hypothetical protein
VPFFELLIYGGRRVRGGTTLSFYQQNAKNCECVSGKRERGFNLALVLLR